jgi:hypothetical protein
MAVGGLSESSIRRKAWVHRAKTTRHTAKRRSPGSPVPHREAQQVEQREGGEGHRRGEGTAEGRVHPKGGEGHQDGARGEHRHVDLAGEGGRGWLDGGVSLCPSNAPWHGLRLDAQEKPFSKASSGPEAHCSPGQTTPNPRRTPTPPHHPQQLRAADCLELRLPQRPDALSVWLLPGVELDGLDAWASRVCAWRGWFDRNRACYSSRGGVIGTEPATLLQSARAAAVRGAATH